MKKIIAVIVLLILSTQLVLAHSGRTNKDGCHRDTKNGTYHCH